MPTNPKISVQSRPTKRQSVQHLTPVASKVVDRKKTPAKQMSSIPLELDQDSKSTGHGQMEDFVSALWPLLEDKLNSWMTTFVETKVEEAAAKAVNDYLTTEFFKEEVKNYIEEILPTLITDPIMARCDDLEQYSRRNNIRIIGVPETAEENTDKITIDLVQQKLGVELKENDICRTHRVGRKKPGQHRQIIVKLTRHNIKSTIMRKKKVLREAGSDVKIQEDLTHGRLDAIKELNKHKENIHTLWTIDGTINIRLKSNREEIISIRILNDLGKVISKLVSE